MATGRAGSVIRHLSRAALFQTGTGLTDGELLECFIARRDEAAFEVLMRRHGPMVLGVCRRVLRNDADAQDALQATFLVLVHKASSVVPRALVGNWLYGVAHNTALKAKAMKRKRLAKEREAGATARAETPNEEWPQLNALLYAELSRLPDKYRVPIVLCELEGKLVREAARQLGWPQGTVASRLSRGRALLAQRLARRGLAISSGVLAATLAQGAALASIPARVVMSTVRAASFAAASKAAAAGVVSAKVAALTEGVIRTMLVTKLKIATALLLVLATVGVGVGGFAYQTLAGQPAASGPQQAQEGPVLILEDGVDEVGFDPPQAPEPHPAHAPKGNGKPTEAPKALLRSRVQAAQRAYEVIWHYYQVGKHDEETVYRWSLRWLDAQRRASDRKADQVAALKEHLHRMKELEKQAPNRPIIANDLRNVHGGLDNPLKKVDLLVTKDGKVSGMEGSTRPDDESVAVTRFFRVEAEIWLAQAEEM